MTLDETCEALRKASDEALQDYRTAYSKYADCDNLDAYGIGEVETPLGFLSCTIGYRSVERKSGSKPAIWTKWFLNGNSITQAEWNRKATND